MLNGVKPTGIEIEGGHIELEITEGDFVGCKFYYDGCKFADEPNDDGTITMTFERIVTNEFVPNDSISFDKFLGDNLVSLLLEMTKRQEVVFKGGTD